MGHTIDLVPVVSHRTLWLWSRDELWIDGKIAGTSGGFVISDRIETTLEHEGSAVPVVVEGRVSWRDLLGIACTIRVGDEVVFDGIVKFAWRW